LFLLVGVDRHLQITAKAAAALLEHLLRIETGDHFLL
jgi:hypothetical protein